MLKIVIKNIQANNDDNIIVFLKDQTHNSWFPKPSFPSTHRIINQKSCLIATKWTQYFLYKFKQCKFLDQLNCVIYNIRCQLHEYYDKCKYMQYREEGIQKMHLKRWVKKLDEHMVWPGFYK